MKAKSLFHWIFVSLLLAAILSGCAAAKISSDNLAAIKTMQPPAGKALLYVVRPQTYGLALHFTVLCDDKKIGELSAKRFIYIVLDPGTHHFVTHAANTSEITVTVEAGQTYFIQQQVVMGAFYAENHFLTLSDLDGRKKLNKCELSPVCPSCTVNK
jgi:hypothetical protein